MSYYNTTRLKGGELKEAEHSAKSQEEIIHGLFTNRFWGLLSPSGVMSRTEYLGYNWPLTSVRRALTNLTKKGILVKTNTKVTGGYGKPEYCWRLRTKGEQIQLF